MTSGAGSDGEWRTGEGPAGRVGGRYERRKERVTGTEGNEMGTEAEMDRH